MAQVTIDLQVPALTGSIWFANAAAWSTYWSQITATIDDTSGLFTGPRLYTGSGTPEGVLTAVAGSEYNEITAGVFVKKWFKLTGSGNTGWQ